MQGNDLAGTSAARILVLFEGIIGFITEKGEEAYERALEEEDWERAARCWTLNELALAKLSDLCVRLSVNVEVITYEGPQQVADALEAILVDEEHVPIRRLVASASPQATARRAGTALDVAAVYDPDPWRSMAYGRKGIHLGSIHQLGL